MAFPKIGLQAFFEDKGFSKGIDQANKKIAEHIAKNKEAAKTATPLNAALEKVGFSFDNVKNKISQFTGINAQALDGIFQITQAFGPMAVAIGAAAIAAVGLGAAFLSLGNRGAPLVGLAESFDRLSASVGISSKTLLVDLRAAAAGTVANFDLIRRANTALVGATGEFGREFGKNLPGLLKAARAAARATGQDVDYLFQSLVTGIKRSSPLLIDNTGIVLKLGAANEALAQKLGKSVTELTEQEKQIAVLNATVEAGAALAESLGDSLETNAEKQARAQATITNTLDTLALAVQPAFATVLDITNRVLSGFEALATALAPILGSISSIITDVLGGALNAVFDIISPIVSAIASFLPYIAILFQGIANIIHGVVSTIGNVVRGIVNFIQSVAKNLFGLDISNLGKALFEGAARAFGSFANGIITVANQLIFPAVIGIVTFIADFLIGFSPPKKGPLANIDKGGENLMLAWLGGITGISLDPVKQVAAEVSALLGDIGKATLPQVDARLTELDLALLPFQNRLDIVKSQFEAIAAPANAALDAIERQTLAAQEALASGDVAAVETVRRLDAARAAIQGQLDAQQAVVDKQQIQLGLATAAQAQERALLNIRKAQLTVTDKTKTAAEKAAALAKEPKAGGAGAALTTPITPGAGFGITPPGEGEGVLGLLGGQSAVDEAIAGIQDAFAGQIDTSQLALFQENQAALGEQFARIGSVDLGKKLGEKFKGLTDLFNPDVENSPANVVSRFFNPDPGVPGSFASFAENLKNVDLHSVGESVGTAVKDVFAFLTGEGEGTLRRILATLLGDSTVEGSIASFFATLPDSIKTALEPIYEFVIGAFEGVFNFFTGTEGFTLKSIIDAAVEFFAALPGQIVAALQNLGASVWAAVAVPVITAINSLIEMVETAIKNFIGGIGDFVQGIVDGLGDFAPQFLRDAAAGLKNTAGGVSFGRISTALPAFLTPAVPGAAGGGLFSGGLLRVGERGSELMASATKQAVFPHEFVTALNALTNVLAQPAPMPIGSSVTNNSSSSFTFNGVQSDNDARRRYNALRASMR